MQEMSVPQAVNRGVNLLGVALLSIDASLALFEVINETEWIDRLDDLVVVALAVAAIVWYLAGSNRFTHSPLPVIFLGLAWIMKVIGLFVIERDDANAAGPDYGLIVTLLLATIVVAYQYLRAPRLVEIPAEQRT
jgi:hypothetical protein